jgi:hypothetical protein
MGSVEAPPRGWEPLGPSCVGRSLVKRGDIANAFLIASAARELLAAARLHRLIEMSRVEKTHREAEVRRQMPHCRAFRGCGADALHPRTRQRVRT